MRSRSHMIAALALASILPLGGDDISIVPQYRRRPEPEPLPPRRTVAQGFPREPSPKSAERISAADAKRARKNAKRLAATQGINAK